MLRPELLMMCMPPDSEGPALARRFVAHALTLLGYEDREPDAALVVSELVGNACRYATERVTVRLEADDELSLRFEIEDDGPGVPSLGTTDATATSGRGLQIVSSIARCWGTAPTDHGKVVWAELALAV